MTARRTVVLVALLGLVLPFARPAWAGEGDAPVAPGAAPQADTDYVAQLTAEELGFLRTRIKDWDTLDGRKKQVIARNVLRIRNLKPEQRQAFEKKIGRLREGGPDDGRRRFHDRATMILVNRGLAEEARRALGQAFDEGMRRRDLSQEAFEMAFSMSFWRTVASGLAAGGEPPAPGALPAEAPEHQKAQYTRAHAEYAAATEAKRRAGLAQRLWFSLAMFKGEQLRRRLQQTDLKGDAYVAAVGAAVRGEWAEAFQGALADPQALLDAVERVEVKRSLRRLIQRSGALDREESTLLVALLARLAGENLVADGDAAGQVDAALKLVLVREFGLAPEEAAKLPAAADAAARSAFLQRFLRTRLAGQGRMLGGPPGRGDGRSDGRGRRTSPALARPDGVSDADWGLFEAAVQELRPGANGRPAFFREKPEGMSDEGYRLLREALQKHFADRKRK